MEGRKNTYPSWLDLFALVTVFFVVSGVCGLLKPLIDRQPWAPAGLGTFISYSLSMLLTIFFAVFAKKARDGERIRSRLFFGKHHHIAYVLWGMVMTVAISIAVEPLIELFPARWYQWLTDAMGRGSWAIMTSIVVAPILEEILFRGIIQDNAMKRWGGYPGMLIASGIFALVHIIPQQVVSAFFISLAIGYVFMQTRSLVAVILIHAINNILAYIQMTLSNGQATTIRELLGNDSWYNVIYWGSVALCVISVVVIASTDLRTKIYRKE